MTARFTMHVGQASDYLKVAKKVHNSKSPLGKHLHEEADLSFLLFQICKQPLVFRVHSNKHAAESSSSQHKP